MRMAKVEELRGQVEILSQDHEREVDRKDALVQVSWGVLRCSCSALSSRARARNTSRRPLTSKRTQALTWPSHLSPDGPCALALHAAAGP
jgi:hypothetical protein